jgi:hypothetical protein
LGKRTVSMSRLMIRPEYIRRVETRGLSLTMCS